VASRLLILDPDNAKVRIEVYRCNLWLLAHTFGGVDWSHVEKASVPRLKTQFYLLMQQADFANSLKVAKSYSTFDRGPESDSLARILATDQRTPSRYRAGAEVLLAEKLDHLDRRDQQQKHYETALEAFECIKHRHGALDIKIARICQYPLDPKLENVEQTINELFNKYESLDYPSGLSSAYLKLLHLAQSLHHTELQAEILNKLERLFRASGAQLLWYTARSSTLSRLKISASDDGKVISGATALWEDLARSDCSRLRGLAAEMLFRAYSALKDQERASTWAKRARLDLPESNEAGLVSQAEGIDLGDLGSLKRFYKDTVQPVDHDTTGHTLEERIEKLEDLLNQLFKIQASHAETSDLMEQAFNRLEEAIRLLKDPTLASFKAAHFHMLQATLLTKKATPRQDVELEMEAIDQLNEAKKIHLGQGRVDQAAFVLQRQALLYFGVFRKFERWHQPDEQQVLETALNLYRVTLDSAIGLGLKFMIRDNAYWVALCQYEQWEKGKCSSGAVLDSLLSAESSADQHRNELSMLQGMQAVVTKRCLSSEKHVRDIYRFAIQVCRSTGDWGQAWMWVQKSKARSLSDLLGLGVLVPRALLDEIEEQEVTKRLYKEECTLLEQLSSAPSTERFQIRVQLDRHQKNMREHERLQELLDLREGISVTLSGLRDSSKQIAKCGDQRRMIFVDWTITQYSILMCVVLTTGEVMICTLNITLREIQEWITEHMNGEQISNVDTETKSPLQGLKEDDEVDEGPLRDLDALILPLSELSDPDDLIVLCPSGPLHSLPLHALRVVNQDGEGLPLIIRNPTVYCASLTAFVQCCRRAAAETPRETMLLNSLLAVYEPEPDVDGSATGDFDLDERRNVYSSVESLATNLHAEAYCGERATSTVLKKSLEETHVVYFLGHCDSNGKTITNQSLRLFNDTDVTGK